MEYSLHQVCELSGLSARTLRYYDEIGLLKPSRVDISRYRYYDSRSLDRLQTILFYRALDVPLSTIRTLISQPNFDKAAALTYHLTRLIAKKQQLETLIQTIQNTLSALKGEKHMQDSEKFEGFKQHLIDENEANYGAEIRARYGDAAMDDSNRAFQSLSRDEYQKAQDLQAQLADLLKRAANGDPSGALAKRAFELHKQWLCFHWPSYTPEAHKGLAELYLQDPRFTEYYEAIAPGSTQFLHDAILSHCR